MRDREQRLFWGVVEGEMLLNYHGKSAEKMLVGDSGAFPGYAFG